MNREQAEKWLKDHDKEPFFDPTRGWCWGAAVKEKSILPAEALMDGDYLFYMQICNTREEAIELAIQNLMELPEEPRIVVDVKAMAEAYAADVHGYPFYDAVPCMVNSKKDFIAGFEAGRKQG